MTPEEIESIENLRQALADEIPPPGHPDRLQFMLDTPKRIERNLALFEEERKTRKLLDFLFNKGYQ